MRLWEDSERGVSKAAFFMCSSPYDFEENWPENSKFHPRVYVNLHLMFHIDIIAQYVPGIIQELYAALSPCSWGILRE